MLLCCPVSPAANIQVLNFNHTPSYNNNNNLLVSWVTWHQNLLRSGIMICPTDHSVLVLPLLAQSSQELNTGNPLKLMTLARKETKKNTGAARSAVSGIRLPAPRRSRQSYRDFSVKTLPKGRPRHNFTRKTPPNMTGGPPAFNGRARHIWLRRLPGQLAHFRWKAWEAKISFASIDFSNGKVGLSEIYQLT